jgi:hypothetical protein
MAAPADDVERKAGAEEASRKFRKEAEAFQEERRVISDSLAQRAVQRKRAGDAAQTRADRIDAESRKLTRRKKSDTLPAGAPAWSVSR